MKTSLKSVRDSKMSGTQQCQRCLKYGHWTYECTNPVAYTYRPSRTLQFKYSPFPPHSNQCREAALRQPFNQDKPPEIPKITDGDRRRTVKRDESDREKSEEPESPSSSESSDESDSDSEECTLSEGRT
jgi:hypothetical protein